MRNSGVGAWEGAGVHGVRTAGAATTALVASATTVYRLLGVSGVTRSFKNYNNNYNKNTHQDGHLLQDGEGRRHLDFLHAANYINHNHRRLRILHMGLWMQTSYYQVIYDNYVIVYISPAEKRAL